MRAVVLTSFGGPEVLQVREIPKPQVGKGQVLIKVSAAGLNRPDIFQRKGNYPAPKGAVQDILGLEVAGYVEEVGADVTKFAVGDRVMALLTGGGYAEYAIAEQGCCLPIPANLSFEEAAALPENLFTVWHNVFERGKLRPGERFLVHGGSGGIGYTAIQLAKSFGAEVFTTVGSAVKMDFVRLLGADHIVNYKETDFASSWSGYTIDVVLDSIGGDYFAKNIALLREEGRLVYINAMQGAKVEVNLMKIMQKRLVLTGSTLRARDVAFKAQLAEQIQNRVMPLMEKGDFIIKIDKIFDLDEAVEAHRYMENGQYLGKIILSL